MKSVKKQRFILQVFSFCYKVKINTETTIYVLTSLNRVINYEDKKIFYPNLSLY
mgnify:CR=1